MPVVPCVSRVPCGGRGYQLLWLHYESEVNQVTCKEMQEKERESQCSLPSSSGKLQDKQRQTPSPGHRAVEQAAAKGDK